MKTVIEMAREAGFAVSYTAAPPKPYYHIAGHGDVLERFAALVREDVLANEREKQQEPVAWMKNQFITDDAGFNIGTDDPEVHFGKDCPEDSGWWPVYAESPMCDSEMIDFARAVITAFKEKNK